MQVGDREKLTVEKEGETREERSTRNRKYEGKKGSESICDEREVKNRGDDWKKRGRKKQVMKCV